jgi:hypothetical protein
MRRPAIEPQRWRSREVLHGRSLIEEMFGSDRNRPLDYERAVVVNAEKKENQKSERTNFFRCMEEFVQKVLDGVDMVRDVR